MEITEEIKLIIEKNLPAQVGETLKETLVKAKKDAENLKFLSIDFENSCKENRKLKEIIETYKQFDNRNLELDAREKEIVNREMKAELEELKYKLVESDKRAVDAVNFVGMALKSPIYRTQSTEHEGGVNTWNSQLNRNEFQKTGYNSKSEIKELD